MSLWPSTIGIRLCTDVLQANETEPCYFNVSPKFRGSQLEIAWGGCTMRHPRSWLAGRAVLAEETYSVLQWLPLILTCSQDRGCDGVFKYLQVYSRASRQEK